MEYKRKQTLSYIVLESMDLQYWLRNYKRFEPTTSFYQIFACQLFVSLIFVVGKFLRLSLVFVHRILVG